MTIRTFISMPYFDEGDQSVYSRDYRLYSFMEVLEREQNNPDAIFEVFGPSPIKNIGWWDARNWYNTFWIKTGDHEWELVAEETLEDANIFTEETY